MMPRLVGTMAARYSCCAAHLFFICFFICVTAGDTQATIVQAEGTARDNGVAAGTTIDLRAYADDGGVPTVKNAVLIPAGAVGTPAVFAPGRAISIGWFFPNVYVPSYSLVAPAIADPAKPAGGASLQSRTAAVPMVPPATGAHGTATYDPTAAKELIAAATVITAGENAAAEVRDPVTVNPGAYPYHPAFGPLQMQMDFSSDRLQASYFGNDSQDPSRPLWLLVIEALPGLAAPGATVTSGVSVYFTHDPSRITLIGDSDASIMQKVRDACSVSQFNVNCADLDTLFNSIYTVATTTSFEPMGLNASAGTLFANVPVRSTWVLMTCTLLLVAAGGLVIHRRRLHASS